MASTTGKGLTPSSSEPKPVAAASGLTIRALAIGLILLVVLTVWMALGASTLIWEHTSAYLQPLIIFFPFIVVVGLVQSKVKFTGAELSVIYTLLFWSYFGTALTWTPVAVAFMIGQQYAWAGAGVRVAVPWTNNVIPAFWGDAWFWVAGAVILAYMGIFYSYIWRRQLVEVERLPFPLTQVAITLIQSASGQSEEGKGILKNRLFWYGFLIAILFTLPGWTKTVAAYLGIPAPIVSGTGTGMDEPKTTFYITGVPPPHGTPGWSRIGIGGGFSYELNLIPFLYSVLPNASATLTFNLGALAAGWLLPMDVAISATVAWLLFFWIVPPIQVAMGTFPYVITPTTFWYWNQFQYWYNSLTGLNAVDWLIWAVPIALFIAPLIHHRGYFVGTIRAAMKGSKPGEPGWQDPYRLYWIGFVVLVILTMAWFVVFGQILTVALFTTIFYVVMVGGWMRVGAEGWAVQYWSDGLWSNTAVLMTSGATPKQDLPTLAASSGVVGVDTFQAPWNPHQGDPGGYYGDGIGVTRIGQNVKGFLMDHLVATAISIVVSTILTLFVVMWYNSNPAYAYKFGETGLGLPPTTLNMTTLTTQWTHVAIGVVFWIIVYFLRVRLPWFFLNPVGFLITGAVQIAGQAAFSITLAWILKRLAVQTGGARLVDKLTTLLMGSLAGLLMVQLLYEANRTVLNFGLINCACGY